MNKLLRMFRFVKPYKWQLLLFFLFSAGYSASISLPLLLVRKWLGIIIESGEEGELLLVTGLILACWMGKICFMLGRAVAGAYIGCASVRDMTNRVTGHLLQRPLAFFDKWRRGELLARVGAAAGSLAQTVGIFTVLVREPLTIVGVLAVLFYINWKLALIGIVGFPLAVWPITVLGRKVRSITLRVQEVGADRGDAMIQVLGSMRVVKGFGREEYEARRFERSNAVLFEQAMKGTWTGASLRGVVEAVNGVGVVGVVLIGGLLARRGIAGFTAKDFFTFLFALMTLHGPTRAIGGVNSAINAFLPGAERFFELLDVKDSLPVPKSPVRVGPPAEAIVLRDVSFSYGREEVLAGVDMEIEAGKITAIVGPSGSGKSTLVNLLTRFYDPLEGSVEVDGIDMTRIEPASWLGHLGLVTQDPVLFNVSILKNIRYGRIDATYDEIAVAARLANIHDDIIRLPQGYDTPAGERGMQLSGGQRQRICLARALVRNPALLLLDEATSSLDSVSERIVQEAIARAQVGRTSVVVAHRLSTVIDADRIYVLVGGRIEAVGTHAELIEKSRTYAKLWSIQQGEAVASA